MYSDFLKNNAATVEMPENAMNMMTGTCLGFTSAICGAAIVTILDTSPHIEKLNGTNKGGKTSEFT